MRELNSCRARLEELNQEFFQILAKRRSITKKIQKAKKESGDNCYAPERELELFRRQSEFFETCSLKELWSFSLIMEDQAGDSYPKWSEGEHLKDKAQNMERIAHRINPLLVLLFHPEKISLDAIESEFSFLETLIKGLSAGER